MSKLLKIHPENPHQRAIDQVVECLENGGIIIYPNDTVYALGCNANDSKAIEKLSKIKGIKSEKNKFSIVCNNLSHLAKFAKPIYTTTFRVLKAALPGPFTFILDASRDLPIGFKGRKQIGIRVPDHLVPKMIVEKLGYPLVSTSLHAENRSEYLTDPDVIFEQFGSVVDIIIDSGEGSEIVSTIVEVQQNEFTVIREGKGNIHDFI